MKRILISMMMFFVMTMVANAVVTKLTIDDIEYTLETDNMTAVVEDIKSAVESLTIPDTIHYYGYKFPVKKLKALRVVK